MCIRDSIINAFSFELGKVTRPYIRERVVDLLTRIDPDLASGVALSLIHICGNPAALLPRRIIPTVHARCWWNETMKKLPMRRIVSLPVLAAFVVDVYKRQGTGRSRPE